MSTSTSSANPQGLGECVVCGKETSTRCSKCKEAGIEWMFFCGQEHQKLIYFAHKRVCGTNPFRWPSFSEREVDSLNRLVREPLHPLREEHRMDGDGETKLESELRKNPSLTMEEVEEIYRLDNIKISQPNLDDAATDLLIKSRSMIWTLTNLREMHLLPSEERMTDETCKLVARRPFDYLAYIEGRAIGHSRVKHQHKQSYSTLQHRLVILVALGSLLPQNADNIPLKLANSRSFFHSRTALIKAVNEGSATTHSGGTKIIVEVLLPALLKELGCNVIEPENPSGFIKNWQKRFGA